MKTIAALFAAALAASAASATAQEAGHGGMDHSGMATDGAMGRMMQAMDGMTAAMPAASSGMVDADFLLMMIPHHQSAIDMARVELEEGEDEETKALAQAVIDAQEAEIADMRAMLERMGVEPPTAPAE